LINITDVFVVEIKTQPSEWLMSFYRRNIIKCWDQQRLAKCQQQNANVLNKQCVGEKNFLIIYFSILYHLLMKQKSVVS